MSRTANIPRACGDAAAWLQCFAGGIRRSGGRFTVKGEWRDDEAQRDYRAVMDLVKELRRIARYWRGNPLGGPAKVFDAMASRIRAGEDYYEVLEDYGFKVARTRSPKRVKA